MLTKRGVAKMMLLATANKPNQFVDPKNLQATGALWEMNFSQYSDEFMEKAMIQCLVWCKDFPMVADIKKAISELRQMEPIKAPQLPPGRSKLQPKAISQAFEAVRIGRTRELMDAVDLSPLKAFARQIFPDISDELIMQNYLELRLSMESMQMCKGCSMDGPYCNSSGFITVPEMNSNGTMKTVMKPCKKRR